MSRTSEPAGARTARGARSGRGASIIALSDFNTMPKSPTIADAYIGRAEGLGSGMRNLDKFSRPLQRARGHARGWRRVPRERAGGVVRGRVGLRRDQRPRRVDHRARRVPCRRRARQGGRRVGKDGPALDHEADKGREAQSERATPTDMSCVTRVRMRDDIVSHACRDTIARRDASHRGRIPSARCPEEGRTAAEERQGSRKACGRLPASLPELSGGSIRQETPGQEAPSCNLAVQDRVLRHFALQPIGATIRLAASDDGSSEACRHRGELAWAG